MPADGWTDGDGAFELRTYANEGFDGAVPGDYIVTFEAGGGKPVGGVPKDMPGPTVLPDGLEAQLTIEAADNDLEIRLP
jgi:hypothetical protein